ncbi:MAG: AAA family ATPase [Bacteroidales bacterium]|nr:AAA family ATPase [Bacteroidales bacterium]
MYLQRKIDKYLSDWSLKSTRKPLLLRGARQVGKSWAVRHLGEQFDHFLEINFEMMPQYKAVFQQDLDVKRIISHLAAISGIPIIPGKTLLFFDEIQECLEALMSLRFFKENMPDLHVVSAGSLLELALDELPTFGVGRIHSMFMYPMTFDEFLLANGHERLLNERNQASVDNPLPETIHNKLVELVRTYMIVGGMPEAVAAWVKNGDFLHCQEIQDDILQGYSDDFPKYRKKVDPELLRKTFLSVASQMTNKFMYSEVSGYKAEEVKKALDLLAKAGLIIPVTHTAANGLPLGSEADPKYRKMLLMDCGIFLRLLKMNIGNIQEITSHILNSSVANLVNKGPVAELMAGLEIQYNKEPNLRHEMYYWQRQAKNSLAEVDYIGIKDMKVLPIEVKANVSGSMASLWIFMREKGLDQAMRCSLENFGKFTYTDTKAEGVLRHVKICPLYAISMMLSI